MNSNRYTLLLLTFIFVTSIFVSGQSFGNSEFPPEGFVAKWKSTESALKRAVMKTMTSMMPSILGISKTFNISSSCKSSFIDVAKGVYHQKMWAIRMLDSSGKSMDGLFSGSVTALGDFDECLSVKSPSNMFQGKYCLADIDLPLPPRRSFTRIEDEISELNAVMEPGTLGAEMSKLAQYLYISQFRFALCVPSTCSADEVELIFRKFLENMKFYFNFHIPNCEILEEVTYTTGEILIIILFVSLITIVIISTMIDLTLTRNSRTEEIKSSEKSLALKCILCFSAYTNFQTLLKNDYNQDSLSIFYGLRVLTMFWIILCHTYLTANFRAHDGLLHAKDIPKSFWFSPIMNGTISVDTFIFMSSVLLSYLCMRIRGKVNMPLYFFKRYWRLTPSMMLVVAFVVVAGRFGSGPIWRETFVDYLSNKCRRAGWWNLLYINNFFPLPETCLSWTWYLSTDTQLFIIGLYITILLKRNPKKGLIAMLLLLLFSVVWTAYTVIYYRLPPVYLQSFFNLDDWTKFAAKLHTPFQVHLPVSSIGLFAGYILATKKINIPEHINTIGWISTGITMPAVVFGAYPWNQGNVPGIAMSALYASTHRVLWGLCLAFITISCSTKKKGIVYSILSWEAFVPLGRLTYLAYLIHYVLIYYFTASVRQTYTYNHLNLLILFLSFVTLTYLVACPLSLLIESPFMALEKVLTNRVTEKKIIPVANMNGLEEKNLKESV